MEGKPTPGPWEWKTTKRPHVQEWSALYGADGKEIINDGSQCARFWPVIVANSPNARLIAAAPDLLAACKAAEASVGRSWFPETPEFVRALRAAIAKAECDMGNPITEPAPSA